MQEVVELRVEAAEWSARPLDLTLHVIVKAGAIPITEQDDREQAGYIEVLKEFKSKGLTAHVIVQQLIDERSSFRKTVLWEAFADALGRLCVPKNMPRDPGRVVSQSQVSPLLWSDDEFPLSRMRKSELVDVDYLSEAA
jgi:hypothetical protein